MSILSFDLTYASTFDATAPLYALAAYRPDGRPKPLLVCMHSYGGNRRQMQGSLVSRAERGFFALGPDMRGRADSAGKQDDGGLEIADIYDAIRCAMEKFPGEIDAENINILGWSGGGGNIYQATVKMPELFRSAQAFYGVADYGYWALSDEQWMRQVSVNVGSVPYEGNRAYLARNAIAAVGNNRCTRFQIFWDEEETLCPKEMNLTYVERARELGLDNISAHESRAGDEGRWHHSGPVRVDLAEALYEPQILAGEFPPARLPDSGTLMVPGFLVTRRFTICLGDGGNAVAEVRYEWGAKKESLQLFNPQAASDAVAWIRFPLDERGAPTELQVNGAPHPGFIHRLDDPGHLYLYNVALEDSFVLEWND